MALLPIHGIIAHDCAVMAQDYFMRLSFNYYDQ